MPDKVLILANSSSGLYDFRNELIAELGKTCQVAASVPAEDKVDDLQSLGCRVIATDVDRRGMNPLRDLKLLMRYRKLLKEEKPDLVITYTIKPNVYGAMACRMGKIPYAANITGLGTAFQSEGLLRKLVIRLYRMALKKARVVFFENSANRQLFLDWRIVPEEKCCLLSGAGVNLQRYTQTPYPQSEKVRFLFMGRIMKEKGIEELTDAMKRLCEEGYNCALDVLGEAEEDYTELIAHCEERGWLYFHGYQLDVRPYIEQAHCFVLPSYHEGMANTNLECASMGRPVITTDIPGCREAVVENQTGLLCRPQDSQSLYEAMKRFLTMTAEQREQMGRFGRDHMEKNFDKRAVVKRTLQALKG